MKTKFQHFNKLNENINNDFCKSVAQYYKLGHAAALAIFLRSKLLGENFDLVEYINGDQEIKEYVYEILKDY